MHKQIFGLCLLFVLLGTTVQAQLSISPYSRYGLGFIFDPTSTRNFAMGGLGVGISGRGSINPINPATYGDLQLTTMDLSLYGGWTSLQTDKTDTYSGNGGIHNVSFAFPTNKNFGLVFGLAPYSRTGYEVVVQDSQMVDGVNEPYATVYSSRGGLNTVFFGIGASFLKNRLNVGGNFSYAFGVSNYSWLNDYENSTFASTNINRRVLVNGIIPRFGVQYSDKIRFNRNENQVKELEKEEDFLQTEQKKWMAEVEKLALELEKIQEKEPEVKARQAEIQKEIDVYNKQIETLAENERENEKEIDKLQKKKSKLQRKYKKVGNKVYKPLSDNEKEATVADRRAEQYKTALEKNAVEKTHLNELIAQDSVPLIIKRKDSVSFRVGGIWEPQIGLSGSELTEFNNGAVFDTLSFSENGSVSLPVLFGFGLSVSKPKKWTAGVDVKMQNWQQFDYFGDANPLTGSLQLSVGGEWIPVYNSSKYRNRIAWRLGARYNTSNLSIDQQNINEAAITLGMGLPLGKPDRSTNIYSRINLGVSVGRRGTTANGLLQENFIRLRLGVSLCDRWFLKRRFD